MRGLALEGGGARGAYHLGVVKALYEGGYTFDGFVGTSIGAVNAAILAQGDFNKALDLWLQITFEQLFCEEELHIVKLMCSCGKKKSLKQTLKDNQSAILKILHCKGLKTNLMKNFLKKHLDETKLRNTGKDFGLVTVSLSEHKPYELFLEDIPKGFLINFVMASSSIPGFIPEIIDGKKYLDGGFYNNCPISLLGNKNYDEIIAIRITHLPISIKNDKTKVKIISPNANLGNILSFTPEDSLARINLGYQDGLKFLKNESNITS